MKKRNCGFVELTDSAGARPVWARGQVISKRCPKSVITSQSLDYLEKFKVWKATGGVPVWEMEARCADALLVLDKEWRKEMENGKIE